MEELRKAKQLVDDGLLDEKGYEIIKSAYIRACQLHIARQLGIFSGESIEESKEAIFKLKTGIEFLDEVLQGPPQGGQDPAEPDAQAADEHAANEQAAEPRASPPSKPASPAGPTPLPPTPPGPEVAPQPAPQAERQQSTTTVRHPSPPKTARLPTRVTPAMAAQSRSAATFDIGGDDSDGFSDDEGGGNHDNDLDPSDIMGNALGNLRFAQEDVGDADFKKMTAARRAEYQVGSDMHASSS